MSTQIKFGLTGILFILVFGFGFWLSRTGKPYNGLIFNFHKLISLGAVIFLAVIVKQAQQAEPLGTAQIAMIVLAAACFLATIATGGVISALKEPPEWAHRLHQVLPYLTALSTAGMIYLL